MPARKYGHILLFGAIGLVGCSASVEPSPTAKPSPNVAMREIRGDALPDGALARLGTARFRHGGRVNCVAFSPDGKRLASGGDEHTLRVWNSHTGTELLRLEDLGCPVTGLAFSPDGQTLALTYRWRASVVDLRTGKQACELELPSDAYPDGKMSVCFAPDGKTLAIGNRNGAIDILDLATGRKLRSLKSVPKRNRRADPEEKADPKAHDGAVLAVAISPNGRLLASGSEDCTFCIWDVKSGKELYRLPHSGYPISSVAFSPDGRLFASANGGHVLISEAATGKKLHLLVDEQMGAVCSVAFSPDGKTVAAGGNRYIRFWDPAVPTKVDRRVPEEYPLAGLPLTGCRHRFQAHESDVLSVCFSPDGKRLASGGGDNTIRVWDPSTGKAILDPGGHHDVVTCVAFSPDGKRLATASRDRTVRLWEPESGKELLKLEGHSEGVTAVSFSPDGQTLASAGRDRTVRLWDPINGKEHRRFSDFEDSWVEGIAFSADGKLMAPGRAGLYFWHPSEDQQKAKKEQYSGAVFSTDGKVRIARAPDGTVAVWTISTGEELVNLGKELWQYRGVPEGNRIDAVALSPDGKLLATGGREGSSFRLWDVATGKQLFGKEQDKGNLTSANSLAFSPDGKILAVGGTSYDIYSEPLDWQWRGRVTLFDTVALKKLRYLEGHQGPVTSVTFSPDGTTLASASVDTTVLIWDMSGQRP